MKNKVFLLLICILCSSAVFAIDVKARIVLSGNLVEESQKSGSDPKYEFFKLNEKAQKDDDGIVIEVNGGNYGGRMGLWYSVDSGTADSGSSVSFRRSNIWIKPVEQMKITTGYVGCDQLFKEKIDDWKVGSPFKFDERDWSNHPGYVNNADVDEMGFCLELIPVNGLIVTGAVARRWGNPGTYGKPFWEYETENNSSTFEAWGLTARYYYNGFCFQAAYRDNGQESWKIARAGVGYEKDSLFAFIQPCFGIDWNTTKEEYELSGICFDVFGQYSVNSWTFSLHVPVTVRLTDLGEKADPSYMEYVAVVKYNTGSHGNLDSLSPYLKIGSITHDGDNSMAFYRFNEDFTDSLNLDIAPGVTFNCGSCEVDVAFEGIIRSKLDKDANNDADFTWKVPFTAKMKF